MDIAAARRYRLTFGPYQGQRLSAIAKTPEGVAYLEHVKVQRNTHRRTLTLPAAWATVDDALQCYLRHLSLSARIAAPKKASV